MYGDGRVLVHCEVLVLHQPLDVLGRYFHFSFPVVQDFFLSPEGTKKTSRQKGYTCASPKQQ